MLSLIPILYSGQKPDCRFVGIEFLEVYTAFYLVSGLNFCFLSGFWSTQVYGLCIRLGKFIYHQ